MSTSALPDLRTIEAASKHVYRCVTPTPQYRWPLLEQALGTELWVKHENHTPTGSFKARTAMAYVAHHLEENPKAKGFIAATRGNHGQAVTLAAKQCGRDACVVVPIGNSAEKNAAMRAQGAELVEYGEDFQAAKEHAMALSGARGLHFVPSFHRLIVAAVASYWVELFRAVKDIDVVYVPIGQGSGICAAVAAAQALGAKPQIVGVVSAHAPAYALSFQKRTLVEAPSTTVLADGLACRKPDPASLDIVLRHVERVVTVTDDQVAAAMRLYFFATHNAVEGAGAAPLAAAVLERQVLQKKRVAVVACGGNVDSELFATVLRAGVQSKA